MSMIRGYRRRADEILATAASSEGRRGFGRFGLAASLRDLSSSDMIIVRFVIPKAPGNARGTTTPDEDNATTPRSIEDRARKRATMAAATSRGNCILFVSGERLKANKKQWRVTALIRPAYVRGWIFPGRAAPGHRVAGWLAGRSSFRNAVYRTGDQLRSLNGA